MHKRGRLCYVEQASSLARLSYSFLIEFQFGRRPLHRRQFLQTAALAAVYGSVKSIGAAGIADQYDGLDTPRYLGELKVVATVVEPKPFTEGPCWDGAGNVFFTNAESKIMKWDGHELSVFRADKNGANGLLIDARDDWLPAKDLPAESRAPI